MECKIIIIIIIIIISHVYEAADKSSFSFQPKCVIFSQHPSKREKRNEVIGHMKHAAMYGRHLYIALGKFTGADAEILKRGRSMSATMVGRRIKLGFRQSKKAEKPLETISFWQNILISIFKFSPSLSRKSYQFFKIY